MSDHFIFISLAILAYVYTVHSTKYGEINNCDYFKKGGQFHLTLICGQNYTETNLNKPDFTIVRKSTNCNGFRFVNSDIDKIDFEQCDLQQIEEKYFTIYHDVQTINATDIGLSSLQSQYFISTELKVFIASHNKITNIPANLFNESIPINRLDLSHNEIQQIDSNAFPMKNQLIAVNLAENLLTEIQPHTFFHLNSLQILDLSNNKLKTLNINILPTQPIQLKEISIGNNQLKELIGFEDILNKMVGIESNHFSCADIKNLSNSSVIPINCSSNNEITKVIETAKAVATIKPTESPIEFTEYPTTTESMYDYIDVTVYVDVDAAALKNNKNSNNESTFVWNKIADPFAVFCALTVLLSIFGLIFTWRKLGDNETTTRFLRRRSNSFRSYCRSYDVVGYDEHLEPVCRINVADE